MKNIIESRISEVALFEDRAHVRRTGKIQVKKGTNTYTAENVSPVLVNKTLNAKLIKSSKSKIINVYVKRGYKILSEEKPDKIQEYEKLLEDIDSALKKLKNENNYTDKILIELEEIHNIFFDELGEDIAWGMDHEGFKEKLSELEKSKNKYHKHKQDIFWEIKEKNKKAKELLERLERLHSPSVVRRADIIINTESSVNEDCEIEIEYLVPGACWRPAYTARLIKNKSFHFECSGTVWQNTGEDWNNADIIFSTERPSLGTEPPELKSDILTVKKRDEEIVVAARDQDITTTGLGKPKKLDMSGIDDGGDICIFRSSYKADIPSDGRPYKVKIFNFDEKAETCLVLMPELEEAVILEVSVSNNSKYPLLAGPVDLIKDYGKIGKTSILYVSPGEKFKIGFGPDNEISVNRNVLRKEIKKKMLSSYHTKEYTIEVKVSNTGRNEKEINMKDRIPVSEIEKLKIEFNPENKSIKPDDNGILNWDIKLKPYERKKINFSYLIHKHNNISNFPL